MKKIALCLFYFVFVAGCNSVSQAPLYQKASTLIKPDIQPEISSQTFVLASKPEEIVATQPADLAALTPQINRQTPERLEKLSRTKTVPLEQLPLLTQTREGLAFTALPETARAFVQALPVETCPVRASAGHERSVLSAVQTAMNQCLDALDTIKIADRCDCKLLAQNNVLLDSLETFAYARGVSAVFVVPDTDNTQSYIAEEVVQKGLDNKLTFYRLGVEVGEATLFPDGTLTADLDQPYAGHWFAEGYRRGHLVVRLFLKTQEDEKMIALVGYEPQELRQRLSELNQWIPK